MQGTGQSHGVDRVGREGVASGPIVRHGKADPFAGIFVARVFIGGAVVVEFDPHTYYFAPEAKDRFDVDMSGSYEGIGARLQKKMDYISIVEIISGGSAWRQNKLEVGDKILKVRQENEAEAVNVVGVRSRAPHPRLEQEAARVINMLPKMKPGRQRGKAVIVPYSLPITFQVQD